MAYADFGLGLGLAYKHDFEAADRFKLAAVELGQREAERKYQRERDAKLDEERLKDKTAETKRRQAKFISDEISMPEGVKGEYWLNKMIPEINKELVGVADITNDPNWEQNPESYQKVKAAGARLNNHPDVLKIARATEEFKRVEADNVKGLLTPEEFKIEQDKFENQFLTKGTLDDYSYNSKEDILTNRMVEYYGKLKPGKDYFGSDLEDKTITTFYNANKELIDNDYKSVPMEEQKVYGSAFAYHKAKSANYTSGEDDKHAKDPDAPGGKETQYEQQWNAAYSLFKENIVDNNPPPGTVNPNGYLYTDSSVGALIPTTKEGALRNNKVVLFTDNPGDSQIQGFDIPVDGVYPIKQSTQTWRKYNGVVYAETLMRVPIFSSQITKEEKDTHFIGIPTGHKNTGNLIIADQFYNDMKTKGAIKQENLKGDEPYYVVKAWVQVNPSQKDILEYGNVGYMSEEEVGSLMSDEEIPVKE